MRLSWEECVGENEEGWIAGTKSQLDKTNSHVPHCIRVTAVHSN